MVKDQRNTMIATVSDEDAGVTEPNAAGLADLLYARFRELGYTRCPRCRDYVDPQVHECAAYAALSWLGGRGAIGYAGPERTPAAEAQP